MRHPANAGWRFFCRLVGGRCCHRLNSITRCTLRPAQERIGNNSSTFFGLLSFSLKWAVCVSIWNNVTIASSLVNSPILNIVDLPIVFIGVFGNGAPFAYKPRQWQPKYQPRLKKAYRIGVFWGNAELVQGLNGWKEMMGLNLLFFPYIFLRGR